MINVGSEVKIVKKTYAGDGRTIGCFGVVTGIEVDENKGWGNNRLVWVLPNIREDQEAWAFFDDELEIVNA